ncbi:MAG: type II secretion system protein [Tepidisphaeraceae bacterium]
MPDTATPVPARSPRHLRMAQGFTLLEMLIAVGTIIVLAGILLVGMNIIGGQAREKQTKTTLGNLKSLSQEVLNESKSREQFTQSTLWKIYYPSLAFPLTANPTPSNVAPIDVSTAAKQQEAVQRTVQLMAFLLSNKTNRDAVSRLPGNKLDDVPVQYKAYFTASADGRLIGSALVDAWGTPCIYVPDRFEYRDLARAGSTGVPNTDVGGISGMTSKSRGGAAIVQHRAPDKSGFWMSAGADGKYETMDDNLFSFDN